MTATPIASTDIDLPKLDAEGRAMLFSDARTANTFTNQPVTDDELRAIWNLAQWPPTAANTQPLRVLFVRTQDGRDRLAPFMADFNRVKTQAAPAVAVLARDTRFHENTSITFPIRPEMEQHFEANSDAREQTGTFNSALQAGYFILAVRANGLGAGPMAGFDGPGIDAEFFPGGRLQTTLVVNIGHPGEGAWFPRLPRLDSDSVLSWA